MNEKLKDLLLNLDLQFFAGEGGEGGAEGGAPEGGTPPATPPTDPATPPATPPAEPEGGADKDKADDKGFTQDDVNAIAAREAKKAQEALLKKLGIEDFDNAKEGMQKFKEWQDSQKTEAQKQAEAFEKAQEELNGYKGTVSELKAEIAALKNDVNPDSLKDVITLANNLVSEDVTIDDAMKQVIEKYPHFKKAQAEDEGDRKKPKFTNGGAGSDKPTELDQWLNAFGK